MISQFCVLSPRGDTIISRDFRGDIPKGAGEIFFRQVKFSSGDAPPICNIDGVNYFFIKRNSLYFVVMTRVNVSPSYMLDFIERTTRVFKDFCGVLNEEAIRKNFVLAYELLDEMIDFGYPQATNSELLKACIHNEAVLVDKAPKPSSGLSLPGAFSQVTSSKTAPSSASSRPVGAIKNEPAALQKNEIFVDIIERLSLTCTSSGSIINSCIDGSIQMKSFLASNPELKLALNEDLVVKNASPSHQYGSVVLDDCNFHECVNLREFEETRMMTLVPPDGEFTVMNYRITDEFKLPFRVTPHVEEISPTKVLEWMSTSSVSVPTSMYYAHYQCSVTDLSTLPMAEHINFPQCAPPAFFS
eukprot:GHVU01142975.1.p1 GENE.GHVU01142975.1~~GHVU01142975.1.p1  ORF type:complete len:358 (+),score=32.09 GHVU01142975.1:26-1099(+)